MENFVTTIWKEARKRDRKYERKDGGRERLASFHSFRGGRFIFSFVFSSFLFSFFLSFFPSCIPDRERERERERERRRLMNIQKRSRGEVSRRQVDSTKKIELFPLERSGKASEV